MRPVGMRGAVGMEEPEEVGSKGVVRAEGALDMDQPRGMQLTRHG